MHICVITSSFPANRQDARAAAGLFVKDFCVELKNQGHRVTVVTPDKIPAEKEDVPGIVAHWYPWLGGKKTLSAMKPYLPHDALAMLSLFRRGRRTLDALVARDRFDHVMAMWAVPAGYLAMGLKKRHGIPFTTWCLGSDIWTYGKYPLIKSIVAKVLRSSDLLFADGIKLAENATLLSGRPCPFMPTSRMLDKSLARPLDLGGDGINFLFVGRYAPVKGVDILLEAMAKYHAQGRRGRLHMFGGGPMDATVRERAKQPDLRDCVTVGGFADEGTYVSHLNACDYLLIPSRMESIPVVLSDALQMGKPVIVSDVGDMGALLRETPAGLVVPPEDARALCDALCEFEEKGASPFTKSVSALAEKFNLTKTSEEWISMIERGIERREPGV